LSLSLLTLFPRTFLGLLKYPRRGLGQ